MKAKLIIVSLTTILIFAQDRIETLSSKIKKDSSRKAIVFDTKTPNVFYCQQDKQLDTSSMIVKAKPLGKLCEFGGEPKPKGKPRDCFNDVDETKFACDEKKRFMQRLKSYPALPNELIIEKDGNFDLHDINIAHKISDLV